MDAFITRKRPKSDDQLERTDIARGPSISPPPKRKALKAVGKAIPETIDLTAEPDVAQNAVDADRSNPQEILNNVVPSPVQLNNVKDLPSSSNVDTVKLSEILGDPMINECWLFNYLFEMDFVM